MVSLHSNKILIKTTVVLAIVEKSRKQGILPRNGNFVSQHDIDWSMSHKQPKQYGHEMLKCSHRNQESKSKRKMYTANKVI